MIEFFQTIFTFRGILYYRTLASLRADARGLYLGYVWWFLEPVLNTALYYFIFGVVLKSKTPDFIAYLLLGTVTFQWFQSTIVASMGTITGRAQLYRQIPLPKYLFALISIFSNTWKFACVFVIILCYVLYATSAVVGLHLLWLPVLFGIQLLVIFGFSILLSIGSAYLLDLSMFVTVLFRALMFLSAIFWNVEKVPEHLEAVFYANPGASLIQGVRNVILNGEHPHYGHMIYLLLLALVLIQAGVLWHRKVDGHILKHLRS